jgi:hypothetical protein
MIVMPSNASGWIWHSLARETGRIGHLHSPGHQRGPWPWIPYSLDNGCFSLWNPKDNSFDESGWKSTGEQSWRHLLFWAQSAPIPAKWVIVPDRPGQWNETAKKWAHYAPELASTTVFNLAVAVQDGCEVSHVMDLDPLPDVICVGGSTEWKWATAEKWIKAFPRVHVLRCNSPEKLYWLESLGCESCDGTGWNRGDRKQTQGIEEWARSRAEPSTPPIWPHCSRSNNKQQMTFA